MVVVVLVCGGVLVAYFLKKSKLKGRTYLAIYNSFYSHDKKGTAHACLKSLGSVETLKKNGMEDPIAFYQEEVDALNKARASEGIRKIGDVSPLMYLGYFPLKSIMEKMGIKKYVDYFKLTNDFQYDLYELLSSLVYARSVNPCSKSRTFHEVLPRLYQPCNYSYDQLLDGVSFIGSNYEKFIEIFTMQTKNVYKIDTATTYFDCTNFYFEIDREDDFRRKGPSKEHRKDPIIGLGLLLDGNQVPIGMKLYPGNESEKPVMRNVIGQLKQRHNITGRTIHVADKGLNCAQNIAFAKKNGEGYLFSKSVKGLPEREKVWVLLDQGFKDVKNKDGTIKYRYKTCMDKFPYTFEYNGKEVHMDIKEKRMLTYNPTLATKKRFEINRMVEKAKTLTMSRAKRNDYGESGKYVLFVDGDGNKASTTINQEAIDNDLRLAGYNLLVTSETTMSDADMYSVYHNLWRIEESFKIMKSDLDTRPVFLQRTDSIKGHFLICYLTVLLERIFQFKVLDNKYSTSEIFSFLKRFKVTKAENKYINTTTNSEFITDFAEMLDLPLTHYLLTETQIKSMLNLKL